MRATPFIFLASSLLCLSESDAWALDILSPTHDGLVIGDTARIIVGCNDTPILTAKIAGLNVGISWTKEVYGNRWVGDLKLPSKGDQTVTLEGKCGGVRASEQLRFNNGIETSVEIADRVIARFLSMNDADRLDWNWGPAIFLYPLLKIAPESTQGPRYMDYVATYHQHHIDKGLPKIDWADRCPSALSAFDLTVKHGQNFAWSSVETVMNWIKTAKRNPLGSIDHLGDSNLPSFFFPSSIWVDSLMMWALLTVRYGLHTGDDALLSFGLEQPSIFASKLRDPNTGLFYHAWNIEKDCPLPADNVPWLRGNGWVLVSIVEMLEEIGPGHDRHDALAALFVELAEATLAHRQPSGYWDTVIIDPGYAYEESSGSALLAYGYAKGARLGLLEPKFRYFARDTFRAITARMKRRSTGFTMEEISAGTNPLNKFGYRMVPKDRNISYGVGAFSLLADELSGDSFENDSLSPDTPEDVDGGADSGGEPDVDAGKDAGTDSDIDPGGDSDLDTDTRSDNEEVTGGRFDVGESSGSCSCRQVASRPPIGRGLAVLLLGCVLACVSRSRWLRATRIPIVPSSGGCRRDGFGLPRWGDGTNIDAAPQPPPRKSA